MVGLLSTRRHRHRPRYRTRRHPLLIPSLRGGVERAAYWDSWCNQVGVISFRASETREVTRRPRCQRERNLWRRARRRAWTISPSTGCVYVVVLDSGIHSKRVILSLHAFKPARARQVSSTTLRAKRSHPRVTHLIISQESSSKAQTHASSFRLALHRLALPGAPPPAVAQRQLDRPELLRLRDEGNSRLRVEHVSGGRWRVLV